MRPGFFIIITSTSSVSIATSASNMPVWTSAISIATFTSPMLFIFFPRMISAPGSAATSIPAFAPLTAYRPAVARIASLSFFVTAIMSTFFSVLFYFFINI